MALFVDRVKIFPRGGRGGNGVTSFRREKYEPRGGPDGGDGGDGGDVYLVATVDKNSLVDLKYRPHLFAENGTHGQGKKQHGRSGKDLYIEVPVGTVIKDECGGILADLDTPGIKALVARGGRGGRGNARFASSQRRAPRFAERGEKGEERTLILELKVLADVGLVGLPNAGKSTLLSSISAARPKVAEYPFTTIAPHLGVVCLGDDRSFVAADIPGLIEGASEGAGLGIAFLRHVERTKVFVYVIDMAGTEGRDPYEDYVGLKREIGRYLQEMLSRPYLIAANKMDLPEASLNLEKFRSNLADADKEKIIPISAATSENTAQLTYEIFDILAKEVALRPEPRYDNEGQIIYLPEMPREDLSVQKEGGVYVVRGSEVEKIAERADFSTPEGIRRFQEQIKKQGVEDELLRMGIEEGDTVRIGNLEFTFYL